MHISEVKTKVSVENRTETEKKILSQLEALKIPFELVDNDVVDTMEECKEIDEALGTEIRKSILLCNRKKTAFYLVVLPAEKRLDVKAFSKKVGLSGLSFASQEYMEKFLKAKPGSASVMGLVNDVDDYVQLVMDKEVAEEEWFGCNTGINTSHLKIKTVDLLKKFLPKIRHHARVMEL
ncbi:MAG: prolyl-tRNA synthetase associated domain-containing protein [Hespellia sp.]|nr:prolyl-tRNA synthetase associated domain-containing protein [Hespellia sp.]